MLNELNKNHMSGVDNQGGDDAFYDLGDAWDRPMPSNFPTKPIKVNRTDRILGKKRVTLNNKKRNF